MADRTTLPLTRFLHRDDLTTLAKEVEKVEQWEMTNGHELRAWEYASALAALHAWQQERGVPMGWVRCLDVGGTGSPLSNILLREGVQSTRVVDPQENTDLAGYRKGGGQPLPAVFCVSVLEHVPESGYMPFLHDLAWSVQEGGLLFLTADAREDMEGEEEVVKDDRHFSWMRSRIYSPKRWMDLAGWFRWHGLELLGEADWFWRGTWVYDFAFCCMALRKRVR